MVATLYQVRRAYNYADGPGFEEAEAETIEVRAVPRALAVPADLRPAVDV